MSKHILLWVLLNHTPTHSYSFPFTLTYSHSLLPTPTHFHVLPSTPTNFHLFPPTLIYSHPLPSTPTHSHQLTLSLNQLTFIFSLSQALSPMFRPLLLILNLTLPMCSFPHPFPVLIQILFKPTQSNPSLAIPTHV